MGGGPSSGHTGAGGPGEVYPGGDPAGAMLEDASIKLSSVAFSLTTLSARAMLTAMIDDETNPLVLAELVKGKMRAKMPDLAQALEGQSMPGWPYRS